MARFAARCLYYIEGQSSCQGGKGVYTGVMSSSTSRTSPELAFFTKPDKALLQLTAVTLLLFFMGLALLWVLLAPSAQTVLALLVAGLSVGMADLFGASAKRLGTLSHVLCVSGFYCGAWLVVFAFDWLFFDLLVMGWMGW